jgi:Zn-dependent peptidase ImmA (M78 family)/DNA-binding XRE family transcriptional regulator
MTSVAITGKVFRWARERAGISNEKLAKRVSAKLEKVRAWEAGKEYPNFQQAQKLASTLGIPLGYLFLSQPPEMTVPIADFRTLPGKEKGAISIDLQAILDDALRKRDWYKEWRQEEGNSPLKFVGKFSARSSAAEIIQDMRQVLDIPPGFAADIRTWEQHLREFVQKVESVGILVLQSGIVGNNTRRKLSVAEFRGFVLADTFAPLIFVNAQDATAARIFTLTHELVHIWTGTSGISNPQFTTDAAEILEIERLCNQIAADFLIPHELFSQTWRSGQDILENVQRLASYFRVSSQVVLRRAFDSGHISYDTYQQSLQEVLRAAKPPTTKGNGGNFYATFFTRNSRRFTTDLLSAVNSGRVSYLDGARLLNTRPDKLIKAMEKMK